MRATGSIRKDAGACELISNELFKKISSVFYEVMLSPKAGESGQTVAFMPANFLLRDLPSKVWVRLYYQ
jgi:hypothetical protein